MPFFKIVCKRYLWCEAFKDKKGVEDDLTICLQRICGKKVKVKLTERKREFLIFVLNLIHII